MSESTPEETRPGPSALIPPARTAAALILPLAAAGTLLIFLHGDGIQAAFPDILATPSVGIPLFALFALSAGLLLLLTLAFIPPVWMLSGTLTAARPLRLRPILASFPDETRAALGLPPPETKEQAAQARSTAPIPADMNTPTLRDHAISLLLVGACWGLQFWLLFAYEEQHPATAFAAIAAVPLLPAFFLKLIQRRHWTWAVEAHFLFLVAFLPFILFLANFLRSAQHLEAWEAAVAATFIYLAILAVHSMTHASWKQAESKPDKQPAPLFRHTPRRIWRWLPFIASFLFLAVILLISISTQLLDGAGKLAGIVSKDVSALVTSPGGSQGATAAGGEHPTGTRLPQGWQEFHTLYRFGAIQVLCGLKGGSPETCYLTRDGSIQFGFRKEKTAPANQPAPPSGSPHD